MDLSGAIDFAARYTAAWCSQDPARVASFFAEDGSLTINAGAPSVGRAAIAAAARGFMSAFPDMVVRMDRVEQKGQIFVYRWTLEGTNTGPGGTGNRVRIGGYEEWVIGAGGLISRSLGHFDAAQYARQLEGGSGSMALEAVHPVLMSSDPSRSILFFARLGFTVTFQDDPVSPRYVAIRRDGVELHLQWQDASQWACTQDRPTYRFLVKDVDGLFETFRSAGVIALSGSPWAAPGDTPWSTREFHVLDPDGNGLQFYRPLGAP